MPSKVKTCTERSRSVADVFRRVNTAVLKLSVHQQKTLRALRQCRTAALGGHVDVCTDCGVVKISYNSCRNRHCPKCQGHKFSTFLSIEAVYQPLRQAVCWAFVLLFF